MKIKVNFMLPTKDFKNSELVALEVRANFELTDTLSKDPEFSVSIPNYMFEELADSEPQFKTTYDINQKGISGLFSERILRRKFMKTQTSKLISSLQEYISGLTSFLNEKYSIENESLKKKIFIRFNHSQVHTTNGLNNAYHGEQISQSFKYFTGYEILTNQYRRNSDFWNTEPRKLYISKIFYAGEGSSLRRQDTGFKDGKVVLPLPSHNQSVESFEKEFSIIDWTEEREIFCEKIKNKFILLNSQLESFLKNIDNEKFDKLIANNELKLLN